MESLVWDKFLYWLMFACVLFGITAAEWCSRWFGRVSPWFWTMATVLMALFAAYRWNRISPLIEQMRLGIRGERIVGNQLEDFRRLGYRVFHDIPGEGFNIDHALIGPGGVFAIETKTRTKTSRNAKVEYDGTSVLVDGIEPDRNPVVQVEAAARYIEKLIKRMAERDVTVRPVVLFPTWFVTKQPKGCKTWVLNVDALRSFVAHEPRRFSDADIALFADRVTRHLTSD